MVFLLISLHAFYMFSIHESYTEFYKLFCIKFHEKKRSVSLEIRVCESKNKRPRIQNKISRTKGN